MKSIITITCFLLQMPLGSLDKQTHFLETFNSAKVQDAKNTDKSPLFAALDYLEAENMEIDICTNNTSLESDRRCPWNFNILGCPYFNYNYCPIINHQPPQSCQPLQLRQRLQPPQPLQSHQSIQPLQPVWYSSSSLGMCSICKHTIFGNQHNCQGYDLQWSMSVDTLYYVSLSSLNHPLTAGRYYWYKGLSPENEPRWLSTDGNFVSHGNVIDWNVRILSMDQLIQNNARIFVKNDKLDIDILDWILKNTPEKSHQSKQIADSDALVRVMKLHLPAQTLKSLVKRLLEFKCDPLQEQKCVNAIHLAVKKDNAEIAEMLYNSLTGIVGKSKERNHLIQHMKPFRVENKIATDNEAFAKLEALRKEKGNTFNEESTCEEFYDILLSWNTDFYSFAEQLLKNKIDGKAFVDFENGFDNERLKEAYGMVSKELQTRLNQCVKCARESSDDYKQLVLPNNQICKIENSKSFLEQYFEDDDLKQVLKYYKNPKTLARCNYGTLHRLVPSLFIGEDLNFPTPDCETFMCDLHMKLYNTTDELCGHSGYPHEWGQITAVKLKTSASKESMQEEQDYSNNIHQSSSSRSGKYGSKDFDSSQSGSSVAFKFKEFGPSASYHNGKSSEKQRHEATRSSRSSYNNNESNYEHRSSNHKTLSHEVVKKDQTCLRCHKTIEREVSENSIGEWKTLK